MMISSYDGKNGNFLSILDMDNFSTQHNRIAPSHVFGKCDQARMFSSSRPTTSPHNMNVSRYRISEVVFLVGGLCGRKGSLAIVYYEGCAIGCVCLVLT